MINEMFISILLVSIAGGCISAVFLVFEKYIYKYTSVRYVVFLNTLVIFSFIIPFYKIFFYIDETNILLHHDFKIIVFTDSETWKDSVFEIIENSLIVDSIVTIWFVGIFVYIVLTLYSYVSWITRIERLSLVVEDRLWVNTLSELCSNQKVKHCIRLVSNYKIKQPCTTGVFKKYIIIPEHLIDKLDNQKIELLLLHELIHIKRNDVAFKLFITILNSFHWFNPLFYLLKQNLNDWIEISCDEKLSQNFTIEQRKAYVNLLFKLAEEGVKNQKYVLCFGSKHVRSLKRRVYSVMKKQNTRNVVGKFIVSMMVFTAISGASVIAKAADLPIYSIFSANMEVADTKTLIPIEDEVLYVDELNYPFVNKVNFIVENETRHNHTYVSTKLQEHKKSSNGSCKVVIYNAKRCTICNAYLKGEVNSTHTYSKCPH